ncbi:hypothetical protein H5T52_10430 [Candidatus Bipolaricaulota bacterium]|nr:hypothetical protein [Candidatus Bipolaricaulota bacterium]
MKRALALLAVFGVLAFGQFPAFTGKWDATVCLLPSTSLTSALTLTTKIAGFDVSGYFRFTGGGIDRVSFSASGALGPFSLKSGMYFKPAPTPEWMGGYLNTSLDFAGLGIGLDVYHWDTDYGSAFFAGTAWPFLTWLDKDNPCPQTPGFGMAYALSTKIDPFAVKVIFADCCEGIEFYKSIITLKGIGLCCGIALNAELTFLKEKGFDSLVLSGIEIPLCCGVSVTAKVTFTVDAKTLETGLKFAGLGDACFTVYGDAIKTGNAWTGIDIYGWKIKCTLGDCNYVEFLTALNPSAIENILGDIFVDCGEFEYVKLGFCGAGCCGGKYTVDLSIYFGSQGGIFDITRLVYSVKIPIMSNFTLNISGTAAAASCASNSFCFGWTFTF